MRILAHDYETTGTDPVTCGVVQSAVAIVDIDIHGHWDVVAQETALHHPGGPIPEGASKVHGIHDRDVATLPYFEESLSVTFEQAAEEFGYEAVLGYNSNRYDNIIARRFGLKDSITEIDMMVAASRLMNRGRLSRARLVDAYENLVGRPAENAHDALADVTMTLDLIRPVMSEFGFSSFPDLVGWLGKPEVDTKMLLPFGKHKGVALDEVPRGYLRWLSRKGDMHQDLAMSVKEVLG